MVVSEVVYGQRRRQQMEIQGSCVTKQNGRRKRHLAVNADDEEEEEAAAVAL